MPFDLEAAGACPGTEARSGDEPVALQSNGAMDAPTIGPDRGSSALAGSAALLDLRPASKVQGGDWVAAYLSDPSAVQGADVLFRQKRSVDLCAARLGLSVSRYYCDSGRPDNASVGRHHLERLLGDARAGAFAIVLVDTAARFGDPAGSATANRLARLGIEVRDATGARLGRRVKGQSVPAGCGGPPTRSATSVSRP